MHEWNIIPHIYIDSILLQQMLPLLISKKFAVIVVLVQDWLACSFTYILTDSLTFSLSLSLPCSLFVVSVFLDRGQKSKFKTMSKRAKETLTDTIDSARTRANQYKHTHTHTHWQRLYFFLVEETYLFADTMLYVYVPFNVCASVCNVQRQWTKTLCLRFANCLVRCCSRKATKPNETKAEQTLFGCWMMFRFR